MPERDEVWTADLNPLIETEPEKARPVLIGQAQALLDAGHRSTLAAPLLARMVDQAEPLRIRIPAAGDLRLDSDIPNDQLRAIDNRRLVPGPLTQAGGRLMAREGEALLEVLELVKD